MAGSLKLDKPPVRVEVLEDFVFRTLTFEDFQKLSLGLQQSANDLFTNAHRRITQNVRCISENENESRNLGLPPEEICDYDDINLTNSLNTFFVVGTQTPGPPQGLGSFKFTNVQIINEDANTIEIASTPSPGFGDPGTAIWGIFGSATWSDYVLDFLEFCLTTPLPLESGKNLQVIEWNFRIEAEMNSPGASPVERPGTDIVRGLDALGRNRLKMTLST